MDANSTEELCNLLKFIDNIGFKHFDVSCYELVLGASYNDSLILATDPPFKKPQLEPELEKEIERRKEKSTDTEHIASATKGNIVKDKEQKTKHGHGKKRAKIFINFLNSFLLHTHTIDSATMSYNNTTAILDPNEGEEKVLQAGVATVVDDSEKPYQVPISQEAINYMLIGE